ncbi:Crp/Fnr family transcriptional regulator [Sphingomonas sp. Xoc002]|uniref:Crp/Fnr family transcriptional regulator n=1 Tax=Sphingomonas sp. Xoc002 TaxID=2837624 RepID=UPI003D185FDF
MSSRHRRDRTAPIRGDVGPAANPVRHALEAVRSAWFGCATTEEWRTLADALVDIIPFRNGAILSGPFDGGAHLHLLVEGWAYRAQGLRDGARQITDILVPGDMCDWMPPAANEEIRASGTARVALLRRTAHGHDPHALAVRQERALIAEIQRLRGQLTSVGRRDARGRIAYLVADLHRRLERVGLVRSCAFACPLTQEQLGDVLGLTAVHINRVVHGLRLDGVLAIGRRQVAILDLTRLHAIAGWQADDDGPLPLSSATPNRRGLL